MSEDENFDDLIESIRQFVRERDWEQFHSPKNLILALVGEVGELAEIFQWLSTEESTRVMEDRALESRVREELADVLIYLVRLADVLSVDLVQAGLARAVIGKTSFSCISTTLGAMRS
jgi:dCTP diphosphatase